MSIKFCLVVHALMQYSHPLSLRFACCRLENPSLSPEGLPSTGPVPCAAGREDCWPAAHQQQEGTQADGTPTF